MLMYRFHIHLDLRYAYTGLFNALSVYKCYSSSGACDFNIGCWVKSEVKKWSMNF